MVGIDLVDCRDDVAIERFQQGIEVVGLIGRARWHSFFAILATTAFLGLTTGQSISLIGRVFGTGFATTFETAGLIVIASAVILTLAEDSGAAAHLAAIAAGSRRRSHWSAPSLALLGLVAGLATTPIGAFAALAPLRRCHSPSQLR